MPPQDEAQSRALQSAALAFLSLQQQEGDSIGPSAVVSSGFNSKVCKHWLAGKCNFDDCKFAHNEDGKTGPRRIQEPWQNRLSEKERGTRLMQAEQSAQAWPMAGAALAAIASVFGSGRSAALSSGQLEAPAQWAQAAEPVFTGTVAEWTALMAAQQTASAGPMAGLASMAVASLGLQHSVPAPAAATAIVYSHGGGGARNNMYAAGAAAAAAAAAAAPAPLVMNTKWGGGADKLASSLKEKLMANRKKAQEQAAQEATMAEEIQTLVQVAALGVEAPAAVENPNIEAMRLAAVDTPAPVFKKTKLSW